MSEDRLVFPDGSEYAFVEKPADPQTQPLVMEFLIQPGAAGPLPHFHPAPVRETFAVTDGEFELKLHGDWRRVEAGRSVTVEPGTVHTFRNSSGAPARIRNVHEPAHRFEAYMRELGRIVAANGGTNITPTAAMRLARAMRAYPDTLRPANSAMAVGLALLAGVGRLLRV